MGNYYTERRAQDYNRRWRVFTRRTLAQVHSMIDVAALRHIAGQQGRPPRVLDAACGTGLLLQHLLAQLPDAEAFGVDASAGMLAQARVTLHGHPRVHLHQAQLGTGGLANLPYGLATFDLITCTNALHDIPDPAGTLAGLRRLLAPAGQLVVEDFARRAPPFPGRAFELFVRWIEGSRVRAYTLAEAASLCQQAGLHVVCGRAFTIDWLWHAWVLQTDTAAVRTTAAHP